MNITGLKQADVDAANLKAQGDSVLATRQAWYHTIGDGIRFKQDRGEVPAGTWEQAVADMKSSNPYPDGYVSPTTAMLSSVAALHVSLAAKGQLKS
jgi:hypothetical protein